MFVRNLVPNPMFNADGGSASGGDQGDNSQNSNPSDNTNSHVNNTNEDARKQQENMIPKSRFDEVNNKFKQVQEQLDSLLKEKETKELEEKQKRGEFEELYKQTQSELENAMSFKTRAEQLEGIISEMVEAKLGEIPEELHEIIPDGMTPEQKLSWITKAQAKGLFGMQPQANPKENEPLGDNTNDNSDKHVDVSKMSAMELFMSAYGRKDK